MKNPSFVRASSLSLLALLATAMSCSSTESAASGPEGTRIALTRPADQRMAQGESNRVAIAIERTGFADPVQITFSNLPDGVRVDSDTIPAGDSKRDFVLIASPTARVVERQIVTVTAKGGSRLSTSQTFELTVRPKS